MPHASELAIALTFCVLVVSIIVWLIQVSGLAGIAPTQFNQTSINDLASCEYVLNVGGSNATLRCGRDCMQQCVARVEP